MNSIRNLKLSFNSNDKYFIYVFYESLAFQLVVY